MYTNINSGQRPSGHFLLYIAWETYWFSYLASEREHRTRQAQVSASGKCQRHLYINLKRSDEFTKIVDISDNSFWKLLVAQKPSVCGSDAILTIFRGCVTAEPSGCVIPAPNRVWPVLPIRSSRGCGRGRRRRNLQRRPNLSPRGAWASGL